MNCVIVDHEEICKGGGETKERDATGEERRGRSVVKRGMKDFTWKFCF